MILHRLRSGQVAEIGAAVAVLPIGSIEQHSDHLPLGTDSLLVQAVATAVEAAAPDRVLLLPTVTYGASDHHDTSPGTVSCGTEALAHTVLRLVESLQRSTGVERFLILNGHGGNTPAVRLVIERLVRTSPAPAVLGVSYWDAMFDVLAERGHPYGEPMGHADHVETSLMLLLHPELVDMSLARPDGFVDGLPGWVMTGGRFAARTARGGVGDPTRATATEGERFLAAATTGVVRVVELFA